MPMPLTADETARLVNTPTNDQQPWLNLPRLPFSYFWQIEVRSTVLYLQIKKRHWYWPFTFGQIEDKTSEYFSHHGVLTQDLLDMMSMKGRAMAKRYDPKKEIVKAFKAVKFNVPVRVVKG